MEKLELTNSSFDTDLRVHSLPVHGPTFRLAFKAREIFPQITWLEPDQKKNEDSELHYVAIS